LAAREPHPWLMPLPRRVAVLGLAVAWLAVEAWAEPLGLWFWLAAGLVAYGAWDFFLSGTYPARGEP
jgi:hypothetical protein